MLSTFKYQVGGLIFSSSGSNHEIVLKIIANPTNLFTHRYIFWLVHKCGDKL